MKNKKTLTNLKSKILAECSAIIIFVILILFLHPKVGEIIIDRDILIMGAMLLIIIIIVILVFKDIYAIFKNVRPLPELIPGEKYLLIYFSEKSNQAVLEHLDDYDKKIVEVFSTNVFDYDSSSRDLNVGASYTAKQFVTKTIRLIRSDKVEQAIKNQQKNTTDTQETYLIRGENLDRIVANKFPRITDEQDWDYVKRIFPSLCEENPNSAVSILFGKSITELDVVNKYLAGTFLSSNKKPRDIKMFLNGFHRDPAY